MFKILIAVDGSEHAGHAIEAVARLPNGSGGMARETGADHFALGTRGMGAVGSLFLGSVALGVVRRSHVPVLLVK